MATYAELFSLHADADFKNRVAVACTVKAAAWIDDAQRTQGQLELANSTFTSPLQIAGRAWAYALASNKDLNLSQITGADDAQLQAKVDIAMEALAGGGIT